MDNFEHSNAYNTTLRTHTELWLWYSAVEEKDLFLAKSAADAEPSVLAAVLVEMAILIHHVMKHTTKLALPYLIRCSSVTITWNLSHRDKGRALLYVLTKYINGDIKIGKTNNLHRRDKQQYVREIKCHFVCRVIPCPVVRYTELYENPSNVESLSAYSKLIAKC